VQCHLFFFIVISELWCHVIHSTKRCNVENGV